MGYCADGSGFATLKRDADIAELKDKLDALDVRFDWSIDKDSVDFYESDKYHEDATIEFLDTLAPYVAEGEANYTGEDGCAWRFRFDPDEQEWVEESAMIDYNFESYTDEQKRCRHHVPAQGIRNVQKGIRPDSSSQGSSA